ncbi:OmpA family protein [Neolewinella persica]|uniref:OmpA family protein n=1 Tax=Neolewinella persica TaxID=70998 RepID=UPI000362CA10|nr:OmpA family protein [Neolewinella persica]
MKYLFTLLAILAITLSVSGQKETINLEASIYFASASHQPAEVEMNKLAEFADKLTSYADYTLKIEAFTDEQGTDDYNAALALRRADAIAKALALRAVVATTTKVITYGEELARTNTTDDAERRMDRRVDLVATVVRWTDAAAAIQAARAGQLQSLTIGDPTVRQTISGRNGGVFMIEGNSFVRADGTPAEGAVSVELVEAYDLSDMILAGLTTTSAGKRLATGGMVNITATDATGAALQLRDGIALTASIPTDDFNERMRIFSGAEHNESGAPTDWALTETGVAPTAEAFFVVDNALLDIDVFRVSAERAVGQRLAVWRRTNPEPKKPKLLRPKSTNKPPVKVNVEKIAYEPKGLKKIFMSKQKRAEETAKKRAIAERTYQRRQARYEENLEYERTRPARNQEIQENYEKELATWEIAFEAAKNGYTEEATQILSAEAKKRREAYLAAREARIAALGDELAGMEDLSGRSGDVSRYFFSVARLGWTNVDIYTSDEDPIQVLASLPNSTERATVVMVPTDRRSVIAYNPDGEGNWKRGGIPRGVAYHVVAYQVLNGQLMMAHRFVDAADDKTVETLSFEPVAVTELKDKLAGILGS